MELIGEPGMYQGLAAALGLGLLVGIERGWSARHEGPGRRVAGLRTFALLGLTGGLVGMLVSLVHPLLAIVLLAGAVAALVAGYVRDMQVDNNVSATTTLAGLLVLCLGVLATNGYATIAVASAAVATLILSMRSTLHGWLRGMSETEILAVGRFALIALVVLPLLPDQNYGPYEAWNPRRLWATVVLVCGLSFAGYVASRRFGSTRGTLATAATGSLVSSTAVTVALARRLREASEPPTILASGISLASAVMYLRVLTLTAILAGFAWPTLAIAIGPAAAFAVLYAAWAVRHAGATATPSGVSVGNPFDILPALGLAASVAAISVAAHWAMTRFGDTGTGMVLMISGIADADAAIISLAGLPPDTLSPRLAGLVIAAPVMLNTILKAVLTCATAGWHQGWRAALPLLASVAVGLITFTLWALV